jgi:O-antigen/teichoic acid export membrane protein
MINLKKVVSFFKNTSGSLKFNVGSMFVSNLIYAFCNWFSLSLIAKFTNNFYLGQYTLVLAIITPLFLFSNMQLRSLIITDKENGENLQTYLSFRVLSLTLLWFFLFIISIFINVDKSILFLVLGIKSIEGISDIFNAKYQQKEVMHYITTSVSLKSIAGLIGMLCGFLIWKNINAAFWVSLLFTFLVFLIIDIKMIVRIENLSFKLNFEYQKIKNIFILALPLALVSLIISFNSSISKFYIEALMGTEAQGIFSAVAYTMILGTFIANAVGQSFAPRLSKYFKENKFSQFYSLQKKFLLFNIILGVLGVCFAFLFGEFVLNILYNETIAKYNNLFILIMISAVFVYVATALGYTLTAMRAFKIQPIINIFSLILNATLSYFFIKEWNMFGAVYSLIIVYFFQNCISYFYIQKHLKDKMANEKV